MRVAVIGVGHLGRYHVQNLINIRKADVCGIYDIQKDRSLAVAEEFDVRVFDDLDSLLDSCDVVSLATPATTHYSIAGQILEKGKDLFVEKPLCCSSSQAKEIINLAEKKGCILQVGHIERYNPAIVALNPLLDNPKYLEFFRIAPFNNRGTDTSVIMDLMIHDIDLLNYILGYRKPEKIVAHGASLFSEEYDLVKAHFSYIDGVWAECTASRVSLESKRKLRIFQQGELIDIDLSDSSVRDIKIKDYARQEIEIEDLKIKKSNYLLNELNDFITNVNNRTKPLTGGSEALFAIEIAEEITCILKKQHSH
ncbi:MAG: Gfo/Idh/MocA family oxidoreductase [Candidatus Coatesbacteria bacterium]|nr:Gfo/Idh/MocA family oxidoreductase [Candidatus Coatesbacteria bacterium]